jgi:tripartite-type tricarboxylate transporter receptor subunit TctC
MQYAPKAALALSLIVPLCLNSGPAATAQPAAYPNKPIRFIVAQTPGSSIDAISRVVATKMGELLGQQFVVDNRTGAGGIIAGGIVASAEPNGYTLLSASLSSQIIGPLLYKKAATYDPLRDFASIGPFAVTQNVLVTNPQVPYRSVKELIAYAKANPGKINWANSGTGFQSHLAGVLFTHMANIDVLHVPYKGAGLSVPAVISGESHVTLGPAPALMGHVQSGRLRALAIGSEKRSTLWPEIPTVIESGLPGYVSDGWAGIVAPKGIPKAILEKLSATLVSTVSDRTTVEALKRIGAEPLVGSPADFTKIVAKEWKNLGDAIRVSNLKVD